jgi:hypothetical protein
MKNCLKEGIEEDVKGEEEIKKKKKNYKLKYDNKEEGKRGKEKKNSIRMNEEKQNKSISVPQPGTLDH